MTPAELAAYIGAAAWLPQIGSWLYRRYVRPEVVIVPEKTLEIGYTSFGPIFNVRLALTVNRKDVIIDGLEAIIQHETGDRHTLTWVGMRENLSEISDAAGNRQLIDKEQPAIALKLSTAALVEKFVRFQEHSFLERGREFANDLYALAIFISNRADSSPADILKSKEYRDLIAYARQGFWWMAGSYTVKFRARALHEIELDENTYTFELSQHDIDALKNNLTSLERFYEQTAYVNTPDFQPAQITWTWRNPTLRKPGPS